MRVKNILVAVIAASVGAMVACSEGGGTRSVTLGEGPTAPGSAQLTAPTPESPASNVQITVARPTFIARNGTSTVNGTRTYEFQVSDRTDFLSTVASGTGIAEGTGGTTSFTPSADLQSGTQMYWRVRMTQGAVTSSYSTTAQFRTRAGGFNRPGELSDLMTGGETIGTRVGSTTFMGTRGLRVDDRNSFVRYTLATTLTSGEISVEVEGLQPNQPNEKPRIFSMMDGNGRLFDSRFLFNVQYRGIPGNPDNAISYKVLMGDNALKYEPDFGARAAGVRILNPNTTYLWTARWGTTFRLTVREGGATGPIIYDRSENTAGTYNPVPQTVYLGANDPDIESGSVGGAIYRNLWVGSGPRPASLNSAVNRR